jgi:hypothetical protein
LAPGLTLSGTENGSLSVGINGNDVNLTPVVPGGRPLALAGGNLGGVDLQAASSPFWHQTGTFNIALALHPNGVSDPFSLSVSSIGSPTAGLDQGTMPLGYSSAISLSLTGVTLPDGTPLSAGGYGASFASGMPLPEQPVPEPQSIALWGLLVAAVVTIRRRASSTKAAGIREERASVWPA